MKIIKFLQQRVYLVGVITAVFSVVSLIFLVVVPNSILNDRTVVVQQNLVDLSENHLNEPEIKEHYNLYIYKNGAASLETDDGFIVNINEQLNNRFVNWGQLQSTPTKLYRTTFEEQNYFYYVVVLDDEYYVVTFYKIQEITEYVDTFRLFALAIIAILYVSTIIVLGLFVNSRFILGVAYYNPNTKLRTRYALISRFHRRRISEYDLNYIIIENLSEILNAIGYKDADILHKHVGEVFEEIYMREGLYQISKNRFMALNDHKMDNTLIESIFNESITDRIGKQIYSFKLRILTINEELVKTLTAEQVLNRFDFAYSYVRRTNDRTYFIDSRMLKYYEDSEYFQENFEEALDKGWLKNFYQPKVNPTNGQIVACETLSRWDDGTRMISPRHYMSLAEATGKITEIDLHSFENSCRMVQTLEHDKLLTDGFKVATNFSTITLKNLDINDLQKIIDDYSIRPENLSIEIKRSIMIDIKDIAGTLEEISNLGIDIAYDSFGANDASLSVLPLLNAKEINLDKHALPNLEDPKEVMIYVSLITMAKKLGLKVNAKGLKSKEQVEFLKDRVDTCQGDFYSKPMDKKRFIQLLK